MVGVSEARKWILGLGRRNLLASPASRILAGHIIFGGTHCHMRLHRQTCCPIPNSQFPSCCLTFSSAIHHLILPVHVLSTTLPPTSFRSFDLQLCMTLKTLAQLRGRFKSNRPFPPSADACAHKRLAACSSSLRSTQPLTLGRHHASSSGIIIVSCGHIIARTSSRIALSATIISQIYPSPPIPRHSYPAD